MKVIKTVMAGAVAMALVSFGANASQGNGVVNFKGKVIEAPCSIAAESVDQTIDFGQVSRAQLASANGISEQKNLNIKLLNCALSSGASGDGIKGVKVTFSGNTVGTNSTELVTDGPTNTAVKISGYGKDVTFGTATDAVALTDGNNALHFTTWVKQATGKTVAEGDFTALTNFALAYE